MSRHGQHGGRHDRPDQPLAALYGHPCAHGATDSKACCQDQGRTPVHQPADDEHRKGGEGHHQDNHHLDAVGHHEVQAGPRQSQHQQQADPGLEGPGVAAHPEDDEGRGRAGPRSDSRGNLRWSQGQDEQRHHQHAECPLEGLGGQPGDEDRAGERTDDHRNHYGQDPRQARHAETLEGRRGAQVGGQDAEPVRAVGHVAGKAGQDQQGHGQHRTAACHRVDRPS